MAYSEQVGVENSCVIVLGEQGVPVVFQGKAPGVYRCAACCQEGCDNDRNLWQDGDEHHRIHEQVGQDVAGAGAFFRHHGL